MFEHIQEKQDQIRKSILSSYGVDTIEKGGKRATIGEVRTWGGRKMVKHQDGWVHVDDKGKTKLQTSDGKISESSSEKKDKYLEEHGLDKYPSQGLHIGSEKHNEKTTGMEIKDTEYPILKFGSKKERDDYADKEGGIYHPTDDTKLISSLEHIENRELKSDNHLSTLVSSVQEWSGDDITKDEIKSVVEACKELGFNKNYFKIQIEDNWSQEKESNRIHIKSDQLARSIKDKTSGMSDQKRRDIFYGLIRSNMNGINPVLTKQ